MIETVTMTHTLLPDQPIRTPHGSIRGRRRAGWQLAIGEDDPTVDQPIAVNVLDALRADAKAIGIGDAEVKGAIWLRRILAEHANSSPPDVSPPPTTNTNNNANIDGNVDGNVDGDVDDDDLEGDKD